MIKIENVETWGFEHAMRGMRNPLNSWDKSDSRYATILDCQTIQNMKEGNYIIGENDMKLAKRLIAGGSEHRKFLRQIFVSADITAPLYWWKEFDTYKIGITANSCSTMHTIHSTEFILNDFSHEHLLGEVDDIVTPLGTLNFTIDKLNEWRKEYLKTKDKEAWWQMIQLLPSSYNQKRTITMTYENVFNIIKQRNNHKLDEWNQFVEKLHKLPFLEEFTNV